LLAGKFDLEGYVSSYKGNTKVARLMLVVKRCPELAGEALKLVSAAPALHLRPLPMEMASACTLGG